MGNSDSTPDSRCVPILCPRLPPCFLYGAGSTPDNNYWYNNSHRTGSQYLVVSSHEFVGCGDRGNSDAVQYLSGYMWKTPVTNNQAFVHIRSIGRYDSSVPVCSLLIHLFLCSFVFVLRPLFMGAESCLLYTSPSPRDS